VKIRTGRRNPSNLYLQLGDEPSNHDPCLGFITVGAVSAVIADAINKYVGVFNGPHRIRHAALGTHQNCLADHPMLPESIDPNLTQCPELADCRARCQRRPAHPGEHWHCDPQGLGNRPDDVVQT
jgi:hypothetical protein